MAPRMPARLKARSDTRSSQLPTTTPADRSLPSQSAKSQNLETNPTLRLNPTQSKPGTLSRSEPKRTESLRTQNILKTPNDAGIRKRLARSRRRKEKAAKLNLASLTSALDMSNALDDVFKASNNNNENENANNGQGEEEDQNSNKQKQTNKHVPHIVKAMQQHKSLGSKKGATKRRGQLGTLERERWKRNWDVLNSGIATDPSTRNGQTDDNAGDQEKRRAEQWAALRSHIAGSMAGLST